MDFEKTVTNTPATRVRYHQSHLINGSTSCEKPQDRINLTKLGTILSTSESQAHDDSVVFWLRHVHELYESIAVTQIVEVLSPAENFQFEALNIANQHEIQGRIGLV